MYVYTLIHIIYILYYIILYYIILYYIILYYIILYYIILYIIIIIIYIYIHIYIYILYIIYIQHMGYPRLGRFPLLKHHSEVQRPGWKESRRQPGSIGCMLGPLGCIHIYIYTHRYAIFYKIITFRCVYVLGYIYTHTYTLTHRYVYLLIASQLRHIQCWNVFFSCSVFLRVTSFCICILGFFSIWVSYNDQTRFTGIAHMGLGNNSHARLTVRQSCSPPPNTCSWILRGESITKAVEIIQL